MKLHNSFLLLALATLAAPAALLAQSAADPAPQYSQYSTQQPAPVERSTPDYGNNGYGPNAGQRPAQPRTLILQPAQGVSVRSTMPVQTVATTAGKVELRLNHGIANVTVHKPARGTLIQVDLPAGQTALIHDGLYTFNADTATVRVLHGKAEAYPGSSPGAKGIVLKEDHQLTFGAHPSSEDLNLADVRTDLLSNPASGDHGYAVPYGYYPGYYPYPYYAYGWGPWGYPYGWGYPYLGFGFGFGGWGGWGGGFHGGGRR